MPKRQNTIQDLDNRLKLLFDAFEKAGIVQNDALIQKHLNCFEFDGVKGSIIVDFYKGDA